MDKLTKVRFRRHDDGFYPSQWRSSRFGCGRLRCHSLISVRNSLFLVSFVSVASCRSSSAIRPAAKSGRPDFFGFSNRIIIGSSFSIVSHDDGSCRVPSGEVVAVTNASQAIQSPSSVR